MNRKLLSFLSLFGSVGTLVCCALPALFVALGLGATFASMLSVFPQLIWLSEHKRWVFAIAGGLLLLGGVAQWSARYEACPTDPELAKSCGRSRKISRWIYAIAVLLYLTGGFFAFVAPWLSKQFS